MDFVELKKGFNNFALEIKRLSKVSVSDCMQCAKCSAGCPIAFAMDLLPHQIMRFCMIGAEDRALSSKTIWLCASCQTCTTRCPANIDIAKTMDVLRRIARGRGIVADKNVEAFIQNFLKTVKQHGKVFELGLIMRYNLQSRKPFKDAVFGPLLLRRGRVSLRPHKVKAINEVKKMFERAKAFVGEKR